MNHLSAALKSQKEEHTKETFLLLSRLQRMERNDSKRTEEYSRLLETNTVAEESLRKLREEFSAVLSRLETVEAVGEFEKSSLSGRIEEVKLIKD